MDISRGMATVIYWLNKQLAHAADYLEIWWYPTVLPSYLAYLLAVAQATSHRTENFRPGNTGLTVDSEPGSSQNYQRSYARAPVSWRLLPLLFAAFAYVLTVTMRSLSFSFSQGVRNRVPNVALSERDGVPCTASSSQPHRYIHKMCVPEFGLSILVTQCGRACVRCCRGEENKSGGLKNTAARTRAVHAQVSINDIASFSRFLCW